MTICVNISRKSLIEPIEIRLRKSGTTAKKTLIAFLETRLKATRGDGSTVPLKRAGWTGHSVKVTRHTLRGKRKIRWRISAMCPKLHFDETDITRGFSFFDQQSQCSPDELREFNPIFVQSQWASHWEHDERCYSHRATEYGRASGYSSGYS